MARQPLETDRSCYPESGHEILAAMQERHFWYRGRRRFVFAALRHVLQRGGRLRERLDVADLGGGNGNWLAYLSRAGKLNLGRKLLADASAQSLAQAETVAGPDVEKVRLDLNDPLPWQGEFDVVFLLDVVEHFHDDSRLLRRVPAMLRPGGLCVITVPAVPAFWSWNDEAAGHFRRYRLRDLQALAAACGMEPVLLRYFCFLLTPVYLLARLSLKPHTPQEVRARVERLHRVPRPWLNGLLTLAFCSETPLGVYLPFPWGTSALAVLKNGSGPSGTRDTCFRSALP